MHSASRGGDLKRLYKPLMANRIIDIINRCKSLSIQIGFGAGLAQFKLTKERQSSIDNKAYSTAGQIQLIHVAAEEFAA